jgi:hypothetical protein
MERNIDLDNVSEQDLKHEFMKLSTSEIQENEITVRDFMEFMNVSNKRAAYVLAKYEDKKILKSRKVLVGVSLVNAYSPLIGTWKDVVEKLK